MKTTVRGRPLCAVLLSLALGAGGFAAEAGLLFHLSGDNGTTAEFSAANRPQPTYERDISRIADGARGGALECADAQLLAYRAPGNIHAQRGTLSFFWRSRYPAGPTEFPVFRVGYADHSSWDMVWLRIDYNGHGFDAFVTDASLSRTRVSVTLQPFPAPSAWTHLALAWDETRGIRFYVNGRLAGRVDTTAHYDAALDQFGPHSRIISPYQVQSDYNFMRGGDIDEVRIYDRMLHESGIAKLARGELPGVDDMPFGDDTAQPRFAAQGIRDTDLPFVRTMEDPRTREEWWHRHGFDDAANPPPHYPGAAIAVRKVEIHDAFDLKRWWWKANDGIRETTWPGVYNRSRLPGRNDYFQLPDWDCYVDSGKAVTFTLPNEPWNHIEIAGAAWGAMTRADGAKLFDRPRGRERTVHPLATAATGGKITFTNVEQEQPIGELGAYHVTAGREPAGRTTREFQLQRLAAKPDDPGLRALREFIAGRFPKDERSGVLYANAAPANGIAEPRTLLPLVHVLIPNTWDDLAEGLDGIAIDLPAQNLAPTHAGLLPINVQVKDPLWPLRNMLDFTFSVRPGEAKSLWLDLRDRMLPPGKALYISLAGAGHGFDDRSLEGAKLRLVFKPREAARAEHELDRFTQLRDSYAMLVEERPNNARLDLWNRFKGDLDDLLRVNPDHLLGRQYAAAAVAGAPRPPFTQPEPPAGVPLWAFRQTELLGWVQKFVDFYIDERQSDYGDLGGGIPDDTDLTNIWPGVALMGSEPEKIKRSLRALLEAAYKNGMVTRGLPTIQADELHSYEEGINGLAQALLLEPGSPRLLERAMETARGIESVTGINAAGHRHFRSSYYSGTKVAEEDPWSWSKPYSYLVVHVPQLLVDYNGNPAAKKFMLELADGLLAHRRPGAAGAPGTLPTAIHYGSDREGSIARGGMPWHLFWGAYRWTGERRYLAPIFDGGAASLTAVNANVLDQLALRPEWRGTFARPAAEGRGGGRGGNARGADHLAWQLDGDKAHLERLYASQIETCAQLHYINTEGSLWIDRVSVPIGELQRARLGGIALVRNALYPAHAVSWTFAAPATARSVAILIPDATTDAFRVIAHNLESTPVRATMTGAHITAGEWEIAQGIDTNADDRSDDASTVRRVPFERSRSIEVTLPPRATTVLTLQLKRATTPQWERADLGIDPEDVAIGEGTVRVRVHSLGSVPSPETTIALHDAGGRELATVTVPALEAPLDLQPRTAGAILRVPRGADLAGASVVIDPAARLNEITTANNRVKL